MKKSLIFACAAAALLASCSQDHLDLRDGWGQGGSEVADDGTPQQIKLGTSMTASLSTRGTGTVGGVYDQVNGSYSEAHAWDAQQFNILMFEKRTLRLTTNPEVVSEKGDYYVMADKRYVAPGSSASADYVPDYGSLGGFNTSGSNNAADNANYAFALDGEVSYYPTQGAHDFWAYRLDGTAKASSASDDPESAGDGPIKFKVRPDFQGVSGASDSLYINSDSTVLKVDFKIEGDNDIMVAKATPTDEQKRIIGEDYAVQRTWSAYTSRQNVHPILNFKHMLTRLRFRVIDAELKAAKDNTDETYNGKNPTTENVASNLYVTDIRVFSKTDGTLVAAYSEDNPDTVNFYSVDINRVSFEDFDKDDENFERLGGIDVKAARSKYYENVKDEEDAGYCLPLKEKDATSGKYVPFADASQNAFSGLPNGKPDPVEPSEPGDGYYPPKGGYNPESDTQEDKTQFVGDAIIVYPEPNDNHYYAVFQVWQRIDTQRDYGFGDVVPSEGGAYDDPVATVTEWKSYTVLGEITLDGNKQFQQGYSYTVVVSLHGLEEVNIYVDAEPWLDGGETEIDPDEDDWGEDPVNPSTTVTTKDDGNGTVSYTGSVIAGEYITITATPNEGYELASLQINGDNVTEKYIEYRGQYRYKVGTEPISIEAEFQLIDYTIKGVENGAPITVGEDGSYTVTWGEKLNIGTTVTITTEPADEKEVDKVEVTYGKDNTAVTVTPGATNVYTFEMPASNDVKISVTFKDED